MPRPEKESKVFKLNEPEEVIMSTTHAPHNEHGKEETLVFWICTPEW